MTPKTIGLILVVVGLPVLAVSLLADVVGLGMQPAAFGWKQALGAAAGFVSCMVGLAILWLRRQSE